MKNDFKGVYVKPRNNESPDQYIKRFMKVVRNSGLLDEWRERQVYTKPSVQRRTKHSKAMWRAAQDRLQRE
jgi:small subunit ribosomal protein S21